MTRGISSQERSDGEDGYVVLVVAVSLVFLIAMGAFVIDIGRVMNAQKQLQAAADASATAAAQELDIQATTAVTAKATQYSAIALQKNARPDLPNVSMASGYPQYKCLTTINLPTPCTNPAAANAITVRLQAPVPMMLAQVLGVTSMTVRATSTATMKGGGPPPLDIMIILDTTASMNDDCSASVSGVADPSRLDCALSGVRTLLSSLWPCAYSEGACGAATNGKVTKPYDEVGLMIFPGLESALTMPEEWDCTNNISDADIAAYNSSPVYLVRGLSSDYKTQANTTALNIAPTTSHLARAVAFGTGACTASSYGVESRGGVGTYFADVIQQAQAHLVANGRSTVQNVIILLSDGDASASSSNMTSAKVNDQCQQAITQADAAATAGTWVYAIAYGASTSSTGSCATDTPRISAYSTMQQIASDSTKFYVQPTAGDVSSIFQKVAADLTSTRLVADDTN